MSKRTIVAPHKRIAIAASHLAIDEFPCSLEGYVHVAVDGLELAYIRVSENVGSARSKDIVNNIKYHIPL
jgi:hypothetical protein